MAKTTSPAIELATLSPRWREALPGVEELCRAAAAAALATAPRRKASELSLVLADDATVRDLNRRWRGQDRPTNVLSFPAGGGPAPVALLGDVVLAFETVAREADEQGKSLGDHLAHLVVHGVLHLLGHDHEQDRAAKRMEALETGILAGLGIADPYRARSAAHG